MQASARVGMTLTALPASRTVGVSVAPNSGSISPATTGSSRRSSAPAARAVAGSLRRAASAASGTSTSMKRAVVPETIAGGSARPSAVTARARSITALRSFSGTDPWPPRPRVRMRNCANAFSPTASRNTLRPSTGSQRPPMPSLRQVVGAQRVRAVLAEPLHAAELAVLLVGRGRELDRAGERGARALEPGEGDRLGGHLVLHVGGADAPDEAVLHDAGERRHAPLAGVGRDDVEVSHHRQRAARPVAVQPGHQALPVGELAVELARDAVLRQVAPARPRAASVSLPLVVSTRRSAVNSSRTSSSRACQSCSSRPYLTTVTILARRGWSDVPQPP